MENTDIRIRGLCEALSDREKSLNIAEHFIKQTIKKEAEELTGDELKIYSFMCHSLLKENIKLICDNSESVIERIFLNSLAFVFITQKPLGLFVTPPFHDAPARIKLFRENYKGFLAFWTHYQKMSGSKSAKGFTEFLDTLVQNGEMTVAENQDLNHYLLMHGLEFFNAFHLTPQAGLPDIKVDGKAIRADMLIWIPNNEEFKLVVECDGFEFHSSKESFIADRKRERILRASGYDTLRYAGSEIYNDPVGTSSDLFEYLHNTVANSRNAPQVQNMV